MDEDEKEEKEEKEEEEREEKEEKEKNLSGRRLLQYHHSRKGWVSSSTQSNLHEFLVDCNNS